MMITKKQAKALRILDGAPWPGISASRFARAYYDEPGQQYLFSAVSNQGNGACSGKKAWLCAGSLLGRLAKAGLVYRDYRNEPPRYIITDKGKQELQNYDKNHV